MAPSTQGDTAPPLSALQSTMFPCAPTRSMQPSSKPQAPTLLPCPRLLGRAAQEHRLLAENLVQLGWALVLGHYLGTPAPCFGFLARRDEESTVAELRDLEAVCAVLDPESLLSSTLADWSEPSVCRRASPQQLADVDEALVFNTALVLGGSTRFSATTQLPVLASVDLSSAGPQLAVSCEPRAVPPEQQSLVAHAFRAALEALLLRPDARLRDVDLFTPRDQQLIGVWNGHLPAAVAACIHCKVSEAARLAPDAPAICAWDGDLTYARLEELSSLLASWLRVQGTGRGSVVALRLFKSRWAVVAMLAVVKAGGAFVSIDPTHPQDRQRQIADDAGATMTLMAQELASDAQTWKTASLVVSEASIQGLSSQGHDAVESAVQPGDAAYIVYTSGSTGSPKGIVVEHAALCTGVVEQARAMGIGPGSRVLQFAAYTFDVSVGDMFTALTHGACLCIPSESGRRDDLAGVMAEMKVSHACLTSTVAGLLDPAEVPTLRTLTLGGEPVSRHNLVKWADLVELNNIYGPAECTVWCFVKRSVRAGDNEAKIGFGIGARGWIAHADDSERLMPVGAVGELLVEGPLLARGYLNSPDKTAAAFISAPAWRRRFGPERGRLYRTGDLVRYDAADGAVVFVGRKDTQVKLRGQRIELGEIEYHLQLGIEGPNEVAVDVVQPPTGGGGSVLAAFIGIGDEPSQGTISAEAKARLARIARQARPKMAKFLPTYMIPAVFVPVRAIPLTVSGKTDRRRLRQICSDMSWSELLSMSGSEPAPDDRPNGVAVKTRAEEQMAEAWAELLGVAADDIRPDDGFISLGGDSLKAIHLVAAYRSMGMSLSVADILQNPRLRSMAACAVPAVPAQDGEAAGAAPDDALRDSLVAELAAQCGVAKDDVRAVYPCTPHQEEMMELSLQGVTSQFAHELARLWPTLGLARYKRAWEEVFGLHPILRTRFARGSHDGVLRQVVVDEALEWEAPDGFEAYMAHNFGQTLRLGDRLARWALYSEGGNNQMLIISLHHSLFDALTLHHIFADLYKAYQGEELARHLPGFGVYLGHLQADIRQPKHRAFWREYLAGWEEARPFPSLPEPNHRSRADKGATRFLPFEGGQAFALGDLTLSTLLRASWSLFLAQRTASPTVVFSTFLAGRNARVPGIERLVAPTFCHVPIKATITPGQTVRSFLATLQADAISMMPFEGTGMRAIREAHDPSPAVRNLLVIQPMPGGGGRPATMPGDEDRTFPGAVLRGPRVDAAAMGAFHPFPLLMECVMLDAGIAFRVSFDDAVLDAAAVDDVLDGFVAIIRALPAGLDGAVPGPG